MVGITVFKTIRAINYKVFTPPFSRKKNALVIPTD